MCIFIVIDVNHKLLYIANFELTNPPPAIDRISPHLLEVQILDTKPNAIRQFWAEMQIHSHHCQSLIALALMFINQN